jgi:hypothetical protein
MKLGFTIEQPRSFVFVPDTFPEAREEREKGLEKSTEFMVFLTPAFDPETGLKDMYGRFTFATLPGNCGIVVSTDTWIAEKWRRQGSAARLHKIKDIIARQLGYSLMLSTTISTNMPQVVSAAKAGWKFVDHFKNGRTNNQCLIGIKHLR